MDFDWSSLASMFGNGATAGGSTPSMQAGGGIDPSAMANMINANQSPQMSTFSMPDQSGAIGQNAYGNNWLRNDMSQNQMTGLLGGAAMMLNRRRQPQQQQGITPVQMMQMALQARNGYGALGGSYG